MSTEIKPRVGPTTRQLVVAQNEKFDGRELPSTLANTEVDSLERTGPLAAAKARQRENSRLPINRLPPEILILIATYLGHHKTLINLTHICAHWRWVITNCPMFWTRIWFGRDYMSGSLAGMFFERAGQCMLDVCVSFPKPLCTSRAPRKPQVIPTPSPGKRIRSLHIFNSWPIINRILSTWADALSPLQMLEINASQSMLPSKHAVFVGDALKELDISGFAFQGLRCIRAPNLTTLTLFDGYELPCPATWLFGFLETASALEVVSINAFCRDPDLPPPERTITLPHVRRIELGMAHAPQLALHLICPSATDMRLVDILPDDPTVIISPPFLRRLLERYSVERIDRAAMRVSDINGHKNFSLQFHSPSDTEFEIACDSTGYSHGLFPLEDEPLWAFHALLDGTVSALSSLPLGNVTVFNLYIDHFSPDFTVDPAEIITKLAAVFAKCPNLDEVALLNFPPPCLPVFSGERMPSIQILVINHSEDDPWEELIEHVTEVARVRHSRGVPLKLIEIITATEERSGIEELESLVQEMKYRVEPPQEDSYEWF